MQSQLWQHLTAQFPGEALEWRVVDVSEDSRARLRPQLPYQAVVDRLTRHLHITEWSTHYQAGPQESLICQLTVISAQRTVVLGTRKRYVEVETLAQDAFVYAAELFGLKPQPDITVSYWVDYDDEAKAPLFEPIWQPAVPTEGAPATTDKPAGQQAIDRLVERLRQEGRGLDAARLISRYGGYGNNPQMARELYGALRNLLRDEALTLQPESS